MHMCARHIDNLLVVLGVAAVAGFNDCGWPLWSLVV